MSALRRASASISRDEFLVWWEARGKFLPRDGMGSKPAAGGAASRDASVPPPTRQQLIQHALRSSIPFVGFGIVDNSLMITLGEVVDLTIGQSLGISPLASAALGNMVADVSGIASGGFIESVAYSMGLKDPHLSVAQLRLRVTRTTQMLASMVGIVIGCAIGMFPLLFIDADHHHDKDHEAPPEPPVVVTAE